MKKPIDTSKVIQFFKSLNISKKEKSLTQTTTELTHTKFGISQKPIAAPKKAPHSLVSLMYSEENETLFI